MYHYGYLFRVLSGAEIYTYTQQLFIVSGMDFQDVSPGENALLSAKRSELFADLESSSLLTRRLYLSWWDRREEFLGRQDVADQVSRITGRESAALDRYSKSDSRRFSRFVSVYGIYNIPRFIDILDENGNPIVFAELLRVIRHPAYSTLPLSNDYPKNVRTIDEAFPSREEKLEAIRAWWDASQGTYTRLPDLYTAIASRIDSLRVE